MYATSEAADQVVRMTLNGVEVLLRISGSGASKLAGFLYAALKDQKRTKGRVRLEGMLRTGKPLEVFSIKKEEMQIFTQEAKRYGILYCGLKSKLNADDMCDIMVKSEDAPRINRIVEKLQHGRVAVGTIVPEQSARERDSANPSLARTRTSPPSEPISKSSEKRQNGDENYKRPSLRRELGEIRQNSAPKLGEKKPRKSLSKESK